jgi:hypothetical protein
MKSPRSIAVLGLLLLAVVLLPADSAAGAELIKDGSFESTPPSDDNPNWDEGWLTFAPICDVDTCGDGGGSVGPRTGNNWVWFGGFPTPEEQFVSQEVTIARGPTATLTFYLWLGSSSGNGVDAFRVLMDGEELLEVLEDGEGYGSYTLVTLDVSSYVSDRPHELSFEYAGVGGGVTNFSLDDISLQAGEPADKSVSLSGPKKVKKGKKAKLTAAVQPCAGHEGDTIELFRGAKKMKTATSDASCTAVFKIKVKKTATYRAVSPQQDADHGAGTSKNLKIRAR